MNTRLKIVALALGLGLTASPVLAQTYGGLGYDATESSSYNRDGTLNVWGAHIDPQRGRSTGLLGGFAGGGTADEPAATGSIGGRGGIGPRGMTAY